MIFFDFEKLLRQKKTRIIHFAPCLEMGWIAIRALFSAKDHCVHNSE
jgi:hypothetical protein